MPPQTFYILKTIEQQAFMYGTNPYHNPYHNSCKPPRPSMRALARVMAPSSGLDLKKIEYPSFDGMIINFIRQL